MAIRLVGLSLVILGGFVIYESFAMLHVSESPERNPAGILIAIVSLIVMSIPFVMKRRTAAASQSCGWPPTPMAGRRTSTRVGT
jgi:divalent metal cation (Fe/Co/Zn/Cd) transporter